MLNGLGRDVTSADSTHILHKKKNQPQHIFVVKFSNQHKILHIKNQKLFRKMLHATGKEEWFLSTTVS